MGMFAEIANDQLVQSIALRIKADLEKHAGNPDVCSVLSELGQYVLAQAETHQYQSEFDALRKVFIGPSSTA